MKSAFATITISVLLMNIVSSCRKYEQEPLDIITDSLAYDKEDMRGDNLRRRMVSLYQGLPNGFNRIDSLPLDAATDDGVASSYNTSIEELAKSRITANSNPDKIWNAAYSNIRNVNGYLANMTNMFSISWPSGMISLAGLGHLLHSETVL